MGGVAGRGDAPAGVVNHLHLSAERAHAVQGQVHIATGANVFAGQRHFNRRFAACGKHQQGRYVLAGQAAIDFKTFGLDLAHAMHGHWRATGWAVDADTVLAKGRQQRANRAFLHVVIAVQHHRAFDRRHRRGEKTHRGASIAEKQRLRGQLQFA